MFACVNNSGYQNSRKMCFYYDFNYKIKFLLKHFVCIKRDICHMYVNGNGFDTKELSVVIH